MALIQQRPSMYGQALLEFIEEMKEEERKAGSRFYHEVMVQASQVLSNENTEEAARKSSLNFDDFINEVQSRHQKTSKLRKVSETLQPLVRGLNQYIKIADSLIQAAPSTAQLIYGAAKFVLQLAQEFIDGFDLIVKTMGDVGNRLHAFNTYAEAHEDSEDIRSLLVASYKVILKFWRDASKLFERKSISAFSRSIVDPFTRIWSEYEQQLARYSDYVSFSSQAIEAKRRKDRQRAEENERKDSLKTKISEWISASDSNQSYDVRPRLEELSKLKTVDTCRWLMKEKSFTEWNGSIKRQMLWYNGHPGAGKSVTCAYLIKWLQEQGLDTVYFFCSFREPSTSSVLEMLRSLILQLLRIHLRLFPNPPGELVAIFRNEMEQSAWHLLNPHKAVKVFETLLRWIPKVHIVLDGLDELRSASEQRDRREPRGHDEISEILGELFSLHSEGVVKWFCSSRPELMLEGLFCKSFDCLQVTPSQESVSADIRQFLRLCPSTATHSDKCRERWVERAGGSFLWIWLITRILAGEGCNTEEDIEIKLQEFPEGLEYCYAKTLIKLSERCSTTELDMARRLYTLVAHSLQPLSISEILNALAVRIEASDHSEKRVLSMKQLKRFCFPLFYFSGPEEDERAWVLPVHQTVREFLLGDPSEFQLPKDLHGFFPSKDDANFTIGRDCLAYLKYSRYSTPISMEKLVDITDNDRCHAFLRYAAVFGYRHLGQAPHTRELFGEYRDFMRSPNFWTCVRVQSLIAPHLFVSLVQSERNSMTVVQVSKDKVDHDTASMAFASPIPPWLEAYNEEGHEVIRNYMNWVGEWHNAVAHEHGHVQDFPPMVTGHDGFFNVQLFQESNLSFRCLDQTKVLKDDAILTLGKGTQLSSSIKWKKISGIQNTGDGVMPNIRATPVQEISPSLGKVVMDLTRNCRKISIVMGNSTIPTIPIALHRASPCRSESSSGFKNAREDVHANLKELARALVRHSKTAVAISTTLYAANFQVTGKQDLDVDSAYGSMDDESDNSDDEDATGDDESDNSDDEQKAGDPDNITEYHSIAASFGDDHSFLDCWSRNSQPLFRSNCVVHTDKQLAIWSKSPGYVNFGSPTTGKTINKSFKLPDGSLDEKFRAVRYDFCIQASCNSVDILVTIMADDTIDGKPCSVFELILGNFDIGDILKTESEELVLQHVQRVRHITMRCHDNELLKDTVVSWTASHACVLLPSLRCLPKIVRIDRRLERKERQIMTFNDKLYFPASFPDRICTLFAHDYVDAAQTEQTLFTTVLYRPQRQEKQSKENSDLPTANPVLIEWKSKSFGGWRAWDDQRDGKSQIFIDEKLSSAQIKGKFVDSAQVFCLPVRSGLGWTKQAFLSCW